MTYGVAESCRRCSAPDEEGAEYSSCTATSASTRSKWGPPLTTSPPSEVNRRLAAREAAQWQTRGSLLSFLPPPPSFFPRPTTSTTFILSDNAIQRKTRPHRHWEH